MSKQPSIKKTLSPTPEHTGVIKVDGKANGHFLTVAGEQILIETPFLNTALDGDTVKITVHTKKKKELTGEVRAVIKRRRSTFVGVLKQEADFYFLSPDDRRLYIDILIPVAKLAGATPGQKVMAELDLWTDPKVAPTGKIIRVIGQPGEHNTEMESIVLEKGFAPDFPAEVEAEAKAAKSRMEKEMATEIAARRDFRPIPTYTIDPVDAKDFDDALSFRQISDGQYEVGVHIADVAYFVRPGTELDREAQARATSIYLVDRTIPMLPEILSNDLCSLKEAEDRLTFSAVFTLDRQGNILNEWFGRGIIRSTKRFSYEEVQTILDENAGPYALALTTLNDLAYALRAKKIEAGAITFEDEEVKFELDAAGVPLGVVRKIRTDSHKLIEDFMLLANKRVAEYVSKLNRNKERTFVYRIHEAPDPDKLRGLGDFLKPLGYDLSLGGKKIGAVDINRLLSEAAGQPEENMIARATVKAMQKAIYSTKNIGHYGLAFAHYTHFTSPIRRYPDLMVHRLLAIYLGGHKPSEEMLTHYAELSIHCSEREKQAAEAERDSVKYKQVEYMQGKIGEEYMGIISGVTEWGIYVEERETKAEGMVRLADLTDDYYLLDEKRYAIIGQRTKKKYQLGDLVKIRVKKADLNRKILDYQFV